MFRYIIFSFQYSNVHIRCYRYISKERKKKNETNVYLFPTGEHVSPRAGNGPWGPPGLLDPTDSLRRPGWLVIILCWVGQVRTLN